MNQKTIENPVSIEGVGIHTGFRSRVTINPAPSGHGIVFVRTDVRPPVRIPAIWENIRSSLNACTLGVNGTKIGTVEHLLAAFSALGIDNAEVLVHGPELPILDGSAAPFITLLKKAGIMELPEPKTWLVLKKPVKARLNGSKAEALPAKEPSIFCSISYDHPQLQYQCFSLKLRPRELEEEVAPARTYGFLKDIEKLRAMGLARGGSLENAVVFDEKGVLNPDGLRWENECARHKALDLVGDLSLLGRPLLAEIKAHKTGHSLNHLLVREILTNPECYEIVDHPPSAKEQGEV